MSSSDPHSDCGVSGNQDEQTDWTEEVDVTDSTDEQLVELLSYVEEVGPELGAGVEARDRTAEIVTDAWANRLLVGRSKDVAVGACWYITFRELGEPRPIDVVSETVDVASSKIHSFRQEANEELDVSLNIVQPSEYLPYLRSQLELSVAVSETAQKILQDACVSGNPAGIAAGGMYVAAQNLDESMTLREAAQTVRLSKETVWQRVNDLRD
jgi:transcription initiation factor TFIIB